jgi:cell division protein FtsA
VAIGLRTPNDEAEEIKRRHGCCLVQAVDEGEEIAVAGVGGRSQRAIPRRTLAEILQPRMEEILGLVDAEIKKSRFDGRLAAGVVLTGGQAQLEGTLALAEGILKQQVRLAKPQGVTGLSDVVNAPEYATAVGLINYGQSVLQAGGMPASRGPAAPAGPGLVERIKKLLAEYF